MTSSVRHPGSTQFEGQVVCAGIGHPRTSRCSRRQHNDDAHGGIMEPEETRYRLLGIGPWQTVLGHVRALERFERLCGSQEACSPSAFACIRRRLVLLAFPPTCGPTVLPSLHSSFIRETTRIQMPLHDTSHPAIQTLEDKVVQGVACHGYARSRTESR